MPAGRPTDLTAAVIEDVRRLLPTVLYLETVGDYLGVSRQTWRGWLRRGRAEERRMRRTGADPDPGEAIYLEFFTTHKKALAEGEIYDAGVIKKAAAEQWQAAAWRLERRFPHRWGRKDRAISDEDLNREIAEEMAKVKSGQQAQAPGAPPRRSGSPAGG